MFILESQVGISILESQVVKESRLLPNVKGPSHFYSSKNRQFTVKSAY